MTNAEMIQDLKQFISLELSHNNVDLEKKIDKLEQKMDDGFEEVNLRLDTIMDAVGEDVGDLQSTQKDHELRVTKLETNIA